MEANNTKAMREALEELVANIEMRSSTFGLNVMVDTKTFLDAKAALAAPPRNCDRFGGDIGKLREACARERGINPEEDFPEVFAEWLLAPLTERKGESDASK